MFCKGGEVLIKKLHGCLGKSSSEDLREFLRSKPLFDAEGPMMSSSRILSSVESSSRLSSGLSSSSSSSSSLTSIIPKTRK